MKKRIKKKVLIYDTDDMTSMENNFKRFNIGSSSYQPIMEQPARQTGKYVSTVREFEKVHGVKL